MYEVHTLSLRKIRYLRIFARKTKHYQPTQSLTIDVLIICAWEALWFYHILNNTGEFIQPHFSKFVCGTSGQNAYRLSS